MDILDRITFLLEGREQQELTNYLNLKSVAFSEWKSGKSKSYRKYLIEIAEFFNVSLDYLVYGKEKSSTSELSEEEQELLRIYNNVSEREKGELIGYARRMLETSSPESREDVS